MAFSDEVAKDGRGVVYKLDLSLDSFASIAYRYSTRTDIDANEYDPRLTSIGRVTRGLGADQIFQAGSVDIEFANDDEGVDWMVESATGLDVLKARCRLYIGLYDPADTARPPAFVWKQLGEFVFAGFPERDDEKVRATLVDDSLGFLSEAVLTPTLQDLYDQDTSPSTNPLRQAQYAFWTDGQERQPIPLSWGANFHRAAGPIRTGRATVGIICASPSSAGQALTSVYVTTRGGVSRLVPSSANMFGALEPIWTKGMSSAVTKNGKTVYASWIQFNDRNFGRWWLQQSGPLYTDPSGLSATALGGIAMSATNRADAYRDVIITDIHIAGYPFSAGVVIDKVYQHGVDIITDILTHYSRASASVIDTTSFARVKALRSGAYYAAGSIHGADEQSLPSLREELAAIAASSDFDIFLRWDGKVGLSCRVLDYTSQTATLPSIDETRVANFRDALPRDGQRGAPYNRVSLGEARETPFFVDPPSGPFDDPSGTLSSWGRAIDRTVERGWVDLAHLAQDPWTYRNVRAEIRPVVSFTTDLEALNLELGDYFTLTYTRNLGDPYNGTIFQVEELTLNPETNTVDVVALYCGDLRTEKPYLLDNESLQVLSTGSGARTATVTDASNSVTISSGDIQSDGAQPGDLLILKDATQATNVFTRNRTLLITEVTSATVLKVDIAGDLNFGTAVPFAVSGWEIRVGVANRNSLIGANYPDGVDIYGAVADQLIGGVYADASAAHVLLEG